MAAVFIHTEAMIVADQYQAKNDRHRSGSKSLTYGAFEDVMLR
jgi:hypothetical protein